MVLRKHELEGKLGEESLMIQSGVLRDENPLDTSDGFNGFMLACRHGDLRKCQEMISLGVNINGKDEFDYTPLIIASLCGHYELVQLLLESGALAERNTFQGERCIYNALNDRIRNLLLQYDFSKSSDPYVYWSSHISSLLTRSAPSTSDISLISDISPSSSYSSFELHKFLLSSRTPYFRKKLQAQPETTTWKLASTIPVEALRIVMRYIYLGDVPKDLVPPGSPISEEEVAKGLDKISKLLEVEHIWEAIMAGGNRRLARQRYQDEVERAIKQIGEFFEQNVLGHKMLVDTDRVHEVKWKHDNSIFADILLRADEPTEDEEAAVHSDPDEASPTPDGQEPQNIPVGPAAVAADKKPTRRRSALYPAHKAMLIRSEYFDKMFSGDFLESRRSDHLHVITVDCSPPVLELILTFLYTETTAIPLEHALELLYAADMLFLDGLKSKAAIAISTLGSGTANALVDRTHSGIGPDGETPVEVEVELINIYDVIHAAWELRVQRLEEFTARYLAYRLEDYIDEVDFQDLIRESADRITNREETDTIELLDDIRYYLSERFRLRFEDAGLEDIMDEEGEINADAAATIANHAGATTSIPEITNGQETPSPAVNGATKDTAKNAPKETTKGTIAADKPPTLNLESKDEQPDANAVRTLDGETAEDEFASDAINYQILLGKIDSMLDRLKLDA